MTLDEILDKTVLGALRTSKLPYARLLVIAEAAFSQVNGELAVTYAADENLRPLLRTNLPLVFVAGSVTIPSSVLTDYLRDATLVLSTNDTACLVEPYADFLRTRDTRLAWWAFNDSQLSARANATNGGGAYVGSATLTCIVAPDDPTSPSAPFVASDSYAQDLVSSLTKYLLGKPE